MVTPAARREAVAHLQLAYEVSERRASLGLPERPCRFGEMTYNTVRQHSSLGNLTPAAYATISDPGMQRDGTLRYTGGSAPRPFASLSQKASNEARFFSFVDEVRGATHSQSHSLKLDAWHFTCIACDCEACVKVISLRTVSRIFAASG